MIELTRKPAVSAEVADPWAYQEGDQLELFDRLVNGDTDEQEVLVRRDLLERQRVEGDLKPVDVSVVAKDGKKISNDL